MNRLFACCIPKKEDNKKENEEDFSNLFNYNNNPNPFPNTSIEEDNQLSNNINININSTERSKKEEVTIQNSTIENCKAIPIQPSKQEDTASHTNITDIIVQQNRIIEIEEVSGDLFKDKTITINAAGIVNGGLRGKRDGFTYFGPNQSQNNVVFNDYLINLPGNISGMIHTLFNINFNLSSKAYFLSPGLSENYSEATIFMKIESTLKIERKLFISLGEIHFTVEPNLSTSQISIDITYDANKTRHYDFFKEQRVIKIGRGKRSDIMLYNLSYSRTQTTILFDEANSIWCIQDGIDDRKSTNGTWAFLNWDWKIEEDVQFRIGQNLLKITLLNH